ERGIRGVGDLGAGERDVLRKGDPRDRPLAADLTARVGHAVGGAAPRTRARDRAVLVAEAGRGRVGRLRIAPALPVADAAGARGAVRERGSLARERRGRPRSVATVVERVACDRKIRAEVFEVDRGGGGGKREG